MCVCVRVCVVFACVVFAVANWMSIVVNVFCTSGVPVQALHVDQWTPRARLERARVPPVLWALSNMTPVALLEVAQVCALMSCYITPSDLCFMSCPCSEAVPGQFLWRWRRRCMYLQQRLCWASDMGRRCESLQHLPRSRFTVCSCRMCVCAYFNISCSSCCMPGQFLWRWRGRCMYLQQRLHGDN